jgi:hypothetical protein
MTDFEQPFDMDDPRDNSGDWFSDDVNFEPGEQDIDPILYGQVELAPGVFVNVYLEPGVVFDPAEINFAPLEDLLGVNSPEDDIDPIPDDFDYDDSHVRGPFHDKESMDNWLRETGLGDFSDTFYDKDLDEYFVYVNDTEPG